MKTLAAFLLFATMAFAAGTVTQAGPPQQLGQTSNFVIVIYWTGDATTGSLPPFALQSSSALAGYTILSVETSPGLPAPTNGYSLTLNDAAGYDVLNGAAISLSATTAQAFAASAAASPVNGTLTINISGQSVAGAKGTIYIFFQKPGTNSASNKASPKTTGSSVLSGDGGGGFRNVNIGTGLSFVSNTLTATASGFGGADSQTITASSGTFTIPGSTSVNAFDITFAAASNVSLYTPTTGQARQILIKFTNTTPTSNGITFTGATYTGSCQPVAIASAVTTCMFYWDVATSSWGPQAPPTSPNCPSVSVGGILAAQASGCAGTASAINMSAPIYGGSGGGTANAQTVTLSPAITSLTAGLNVCWKPSNANTGTTPTLAVSGLTATTLVKAGGALAANDLITTAVACAIYDGTNFELQNPQTVSGGVSAGTKISVSGSTVSWNPLDSSVLSGYDDFCGANPGLVSGGGGYWNSKMVYKNVGGSTIASLGPLCGISLTTAATTSATSYIVLGDVGSSITPTPGTTAMTYYVVFSLGNVTQGTFVFGLGSGDNNVIGGASNGIYIEAVAGGSNVILETCGNGSGQTSTSSGVSLAANTVYKATMTTDGAGNACVQVNGGAKQCTASNVTSTALNGNLVIGVKTNANTAVTAKLLYWGYSVPGY